MNRLPTIDITGNQIAVGRVPGMVIGGTNTPDLTPGGASNVWLTEDGTSGWLMEDGSSFFLLEA